MLLRVIVRSKTTYLVMRCSRCFKRIKVAYWHNGQKYGPECVVKVGGIIHKSKKIKIEDAEEKNEKQQELF
jgi:hypothetical protein